MVPGLQAKQKYDPGRAGLEITARCEVALKM